MHQKRVLIIDDEAATRRYLSNSFKDSGYDSESCPDGISGVFTLLKSLKAGKNFDYIVSAIFLPDLSGLQILNAVKAQDSQYPIVLMTNYGDETVKQKVLEHKNVAFIEKPFDFSFLLKSLNDLSPSSTDTRKQQRKKADEVYAAYLTIKIQDKENSKEILRKISAMNEVVLCDAVHGMFDIVVLISSAFQPKIEEILKSIMKLEGIAIASISYLDNSAIDDELNAFVKNYLENGFGLTDRKAVNEKSAILTYLFLDIEPGNINKVYLMCCLSEGVVSCDVLEKSSEIVMTVSGFSNSSDTFKIVEKLRRFQGVLRIREVKVIDMKF